MASFLKKKMRERCANEATARSHRREPMVRLNKTKAVQIPRPLYGIRLSKLSPSPGRVNR